MSVNFDEYFLQINTMIDEQQSVDGIVPILEKVEKYYDEGDDGQKAEIDRLRYVIGTLLYPDDEANAVSWANER